MQRLSSEIKKFIKDADVSYSQLIETLHSRFGIKLGKSTISYYKGSRPRIKPIKLHEISEWELDWLFGLYFADGSKYFERKPRYMYVIKFALDYVRDKDITERLTKLLERMRLKPTFSFRKGCLAIRVFSKELYSIFPSKSDFYEPKDIFAFIAGLIDGDGYVGKYRAVIIQIHQEKIMKYLMEKLKLSRCESKIITMWGKPSIRIAYYVPAKLFKILRSMGYSVKMSREIN